MKSIFCYFAALYLLLYPFTAYPTSLPRPSTADSLPRMWEVTGTAKNGHPLKFYILGVSHTGLDREYDDYLVKKVMPVFNKADVLFHENANIDPVLVTAACPIPLAPTAENNEMISAAREKIRKAQLKYFGKTSRPTVVNGSAKWQAEMAQYSDQGLREYLAKDMADHYSELDLMSANARLDAQIGDIEFKKISKNELKSAINTARKRLGYKGDIVLRVSIANFLIQSRPNIPVESIDTRQDMVDAYCVLGADRTRLFRHEFNSWKIDAPFGKLADVFKTRINDDIAFANSLKSQKITGSLIADADLNSSYLCTRNPRWLTKMMNDTGVQVKFYALGLAHLLPRADGKHPCDDLLTMLKNAGMSVVLIK